MAKNNLNEVIDHFHSKKLVFAAWSCENEFFSTFRNWYFPLRKFFGDFIVFDPQKYYYQYGEEAMNKKFIEIIKKEKPDYLVTYIVNEVIHLETLIKIRKISPNTKIISFFGDDDSQFEDLSRYVALFCDYKLVFQKSYIKQYEDEDLTNAIFTSGVDIHAFHKIKTEKKYDVTFIGTPKESYRYEFIKYLKDNKIKINLFGFGWNNLPEFKDIYLGPLNHEEIINVINQSKINLCLMKNNLGIPHMKGRVFEIGACNSFLLMEDSPYYYDIFKKWKEIIPFSDKEDMLKKVKYYLSNEKEREKVSNAMYKKIKNKYNLEKEFELLFKKIYHEEKNDSFPFQKVPNIKKNIVILEKNDFYNKEKIKIKIKNADYISFKQGKVVYSKYKNYFQVYSLEKSKKQISCCEYYVYSNKLGNYLLSNSNESLNLFGDKYLSESLNINQLIVTKNFFLENIDHFSKLINGKKIDLISNKNTVFISFPLLKIHESSFNKKNLDYEVFKKSFKLIFFRNLRSLVHQKKIFYNKYVYLLFLDAITKRKNFVLKYISEIIQDKNKIETFKKVYT